MADPFAQGDMMFQIVPVFIGIVAVVVIGTILYSVFSAMKQYQKNEQSPKLSVPAIIKTKRTDFRRSTSTDMNHHQENQHFPSSTTSTHTRYFVTFEFESGDRSEFNVTGNEYGMLSEGDIGMLTFQGTRYLGFERKKHIG
ncbi:DUF2500 domain-containing protein [Bacillus alkalicellulosilyticus]|uniref:DUF2500 domain-containing protein n=1 Tax=Alkalihalobacterium alkalicellulosilyticum TaxID=1912214 RepID=UPI000995F75E|nr:DUF2500 domain-containing protein [Bacillus alkalicellulosilyticus]